MRPRSRDRFKNARETAGNGLLDRRVFVKGGLGALATGAFMAFAIGTLRLMAAASAPSARIQSARGSAPASSRSRRSGTPVHSLQDTSPWVCPHVSAGGVG